MPGRLHAIADLIDVNELSELHIGFAIAGDDETERRVSDAVHGREADDGLCNLVPETHVRHASTETQASPIED